MELIKELEDLGVNVKEGLDRVVGDEALYRMLLGMFVDVIGSNPIKEEDFDCEDCEELIRRVHTIKGAAANLSIGPLYTRYSEVLTMLREERQGEAKAAFIQIGDIQNRVIDCITQSEKGV